MFVEYNPNPASIRKVGDCAVRAVSKALNISWETAYIKLVMNGLAMGDMPNANNVIASVLRQNSFKRMDVPADCPDCYTVAEFASKYPRGTYVAGTGVHIVTIKDGNYYDSWDSGDETIAYVWKKEE
jgi:hypothetical protein